MEFLRVPPGWGASCSDQESNELGLSPEGKVRGGGSLIAKRSQHTPLEAQSGNLLNMVKGPQLDPPMTPNTRERSAGQDAIWSLLLYCATLVLHTASTKYVLLVYPSLVFEPVRLLGKHTLKHHDLGLGRIQPSLLSSPVADLGFFLEGVHTPYLRTSVTKQD